MAEQGASIVVIEACGSVRSSTHPEQSPGRSAEPYALNATRDNGPSGNLRIEFSFLENRGMAPSDLTFTCLGESTAEHPGW